MELYVDRVKGQLIKGTGTYLDYHSWCPLHGLHAEEEEVRLESFSFQMMQTWRSNK